MLITFLLLGLEVLQCETTSEIMGWESSDVIRFDLEPLLQGQARTNLEGFITRLLLILEVCNVKTTCRILWAGNLPMSDLTFGPSFKVKRWFTGFGGLSFRWMQICIGSPMRRSSYLLISKLN